jgi:hypothetical protein
MRHSQNPFLENARQRRKLKCVAVSELRVAQSSPLVMQSVQAICRVQLFSPVGNHVVFSNLLDWESKATAFKKGYDYASFYLRFYYWFIATH